MGSAWSVQTGYADSFSYWTSEEKVENDAAVKFQAIAQEFIVQHVYYGVPVKITKKTINPTSPLWFEIEEDILEKYLASDNVSLILAHILSYRIILMICVSGYFEGCAFLLHCRWERID